MTDINNIVENPVDEIKTADEIKKEKLKEYRRNYYKNYFRNNEEQRLKQNERTSLSKSQRYNNDTEYRQKAKDYSKFYKFQKNIEINGKLEKLALMEKIFNNSIDIPNSLLHSKISVKL